MPRITCCLCRRALTSSSTDESESLFRSSAVFITSTSKPTPPVSFAMSNCCAGSLDISSLRFMFIALRNTEVFTACCRTRAQRRRARVDCAGVFLATSVPSSVSSSFPPCTLSVTIPGTARFPPPSAPARMLTASGVWLFRTDFRVRIRPSYEGCVPMIRPYLYETAILKSSSTVGSSSSPRFSFSSPKASPTMPRMRLRSTNKRYAGIPNEYTTNVAYSTSPRTTDLSANKRPSTSNDEPRIISKWKLNPLSNEDSASSEVPSITCPTIVDRTSDMKKMTRKCVKSSDERDNVRTVKSRCLWKSTIFIERSTISNNEMPEIEKYVVRISLSCKIVIIVSPNRSMPVSSVGSSHLFWVAPATTASVRDAFMCLASTSDAASDCPAEALNGIKKFAMGCAGLSYTSYRNSGVSFERCKA